MDPSGEPRSNRDKRASKRYPCDIAGAIIVDRTQHAVRFRDVSALGCCFAGEQALEKGDEIVCVVRGVSVVATIAWSVPPLSGANFHKEINLPQVLRDRTARPAYLNRRLSNVMTGVIDES